MKSLWENYGVIEASFLPEKCNAQTVEMFSPKSTEKFWTPHVEQAVFLLLQ